MRLLRKELKKKTDWLPRARFSPLTFEKARGVACSKEQAGDLGLTIQSAFMLSIAKPNALSIAGFFIHRYLRNPDTMKQERVRIKDLVKVVKQKLEI